MTNMEILALETQMIGFEWDGENLFTYAEWKARGYQVKRGEKAILSTHLWRPFVTEDATTGQTTTKIRFVKCHLFSRGQVQKVAEVK